MVPSFFSVSELRKRVLYRKDTTTRNIFIKSNHMMVLKIYCHSNMGTLFFLTFLLCSGCYY